MADHVLKRDLLLIVGFLVFVTVVVAADLYGGLMSSWSFKRKKRRQRMWKIVGAIIAALLTGGILIWAKMQS